MKKFFILAVAALAAIVSVSVMSSSVKANDEIPSEGTVSFESSAMPVLNFTMPIGQAKNIYRLVPSNIADICAKEYTTIKQKCNSSSDFTYEGVRVKVKKDGSSLTFVFSLNGNKLTASDVTWTELDTIFGSSK